MKKAMTESINIKYNLYVRLYTNICEKLVLNFRSYSDTESYVQQTCFSFHYPYYCTIQLTISINCLFPTPSIYNFLACKLEAQAVAFQTSSTNKKIAAIIATLPMNISIASNIFSFCSLLVLMKADFGKSISRGFTRSATT